MKTLLSITLMMADRILLGVQSVLLLDLAVEMLTFQKKRKFHSSRSQKWLLLQPSLPPTVQKKSNRPNTAKTSLLLSLKEERFGLLQHLSSELPGNYYRVRDNPRYNFAWIDNLTPYLQKLVLTTVELWPGARIFFFVRRTKKKCMKDCVRMSRGHIKTFLLKWHIFP